MAMKEQDAKTYAGWGVDFLKYDLCGLRPIIRLYDPRQDPTKSSAMMRDAYAKMHDALMKTGRPIVYSICQYGVDSVWEWGEEVGGNLWRTTDDISDSYRSMALIGFSQAGLERYAKPGHWNDPDMLEVGNGGMTADQYRTQMSLWAVGNSSCTSTCGQRPEQDGRNHQKYPNERGSHRGGSGQTRDSGVSPRSTSDLGTSIGPWRESGGFVQFCDR